MRRRIAISLVASIVVFAFALAIGVSRQPLAGNGDLSRPFCGAQRLLQGTDPYSCETFHDGRNWPANPLTTILYVLPFLPLGTYAASVIFALSCALLAFASTRRGEYWRLIIFLCPAFWDTFTTFQWGPLFAAIYLLPNLLPLAIVKPQLAIPVILTRLNRFRFVGLAAFGLLTLAIDPMWPLRWIPQAQSYDGYIPLLTFPFGPLLLLALLNWRDDRARFLLFFAAMPQRYFYDLMLLWVLPRTRRETMLLTLWAWLSVLLLRGAWFVSDYRNMALAAFYLPALVLVLYPVGTTSISRAREIAFRPLAAARRRLTSARRA